MVYAELKIEIPEKTWIGEISRSYPETKFKVLAAIPNKDTGTGLLEITGKNLKEILTKIKDYDTIENLSIIKWKEEKAIIQFEISKHLLLFPIKKSGVPIEMPFKIINGECTWEIKTSKSKLSNLKDKLKDHNISFNVKYVNQDIESNQILTSKQKDLMNLAIKKGYYDTPRECSLTELAEELDLAKSTVSERLHRAEEKIIKNHIIED